MNNLLTVSVLNGEGCLVVTIDNDWDQISCAVERGACIISGTTETEISIDNRFSFERI
jgi:hypothetical protein